MKSNFILILILILILQACRQPDEKLTMIRTPYTGNEIRLDGYYTGLSPGQSKYYDNIFFYTNGVVFSFGYLPDIDVNKFLNIMGKGDKTDWHVFQVKNDTINVQGWKDNSSETDIQYVLDNYSYTIINDTTLFYETQGYKTNYYFKKFSPKPDSTNVFIK